MIKLDCVRRSVDWDRVWYIMSPSVDSLVNGTIANTIRYPVGDIMGGLVKSVLGRAKKND